MSHSPIPLDWYWIVPGHPSEVYASARRMYVSLRDVEFAVFKADGNEPTSVKSEDELREVLASAGLTYLNEPPRQLGPADRGEAD